ncbi:MAG: hypothetical protein K2J02_02125 [Malacoplasma sp.]|nr:hypothetical protein [Malacoplasma sp.]
MEKLIILSGAGLSAESGIQTFRSDTGLWNNYDINVVCNYLTWKQNFEIVHKFYNDRRKELKNKKPNLMHIKIAEWKKKLKNNCILITQNIDDLLEKAGCEDVIHLHGYSNKLICTDCDYIYEDLNYKPYDFKKCIKCNSKWIKPYIVFFNEQAPQYLKLHQIFNSVNEKDVVLIIGTSGTVINVNHLLYLSNSTNILNNLKKEPYINERLFEFVFYEKATIAALKIDKIIKEKFKL